MVPSRRSVHSSFLQVPKSRTLSEEGRYATIPRQSHAAPEEETKMSAYNRVIDLLTKDPIYLREVALGKRIGFYKLGEDLGVGNFSKVKLGSHILTKERVAVKVIEKSKLDQKAQKLLAREIKNLEETHHPSIIRLFEVVETLTKLHLILEYAGGGELYDHVVNNVKLTEDVSKSIFAQILAAIIHLHGIGIVHRDIKAENVLFYEPGRVKLGDLGFSVAVEPGRTLNTFCGSPPYAAPELFMDQRYEGELVDIWALGVLLYFMVTGNMPFRGDTIGEIKRQILAGNFEIPNDVSSSCQNLISGILKLEPTQRYTLKAMRDHVWMVNVIFPRPYPKCITAPNEDVDEQPIVREVWEILDKYGVSRSMIREAMERGARNSVIGTYRIVLYQSQARHLVELDPEFYKVEANADQTPKQKLPVPYKKMSSRLCVVI